MARHILSGRKPRRGLQPLLPMEYSVVQWEYSQQSSLVLQLRGLPPAWLHCLENSDTVWQRQRGSTGSTPLLPQWQRSEIQADVKEETSRTLWQLLKAGDVRICSHRGFYRTHTQTHTETDTHRQTGMKPEKRKTGSKHTELFCETKWTLNYLRYAVTSPHNVNVKYVTSR